MLRSRHRQIIRFFGFVILRFLWWDFLLPRVGLGGLSDRTRAERIRSVAVAFRSLAIQMGGVLIKVGQFLSARFDVLPREVTKELEGLQDEVRAEPFSAIRAVVEQEFGTPLEERFASFDPEPIASASIGQVHRARLPEGERPIVVKVQRPRIEEIVRVDLAAIAVVGRWLRRFRAVNRRAHITALIDELSRSLFEEIDYLNEGKNAERFRANCAAEADVDVPEVIWTHTTRRVLALQDVGAVKITDYAEIEAAGINRKEVANRLVDFYLKQIFVDGYYHADPHPGNLFVSRRVSRSDPRAFRLVFVDFGMTGSLSKSTFDALRETLIAVGTQDAARLVEAYRRLNILLPGADLDLIERANRRLLENLWGRSTKDIRDMSAETLQSFGREFGELLYSLPFQVPEELILLVRCVSILSGIAVGLDPEYNVWTSIAPFAEKLIRSNARGFDRVATELARAVRTVADMPRRVDALVRRVEEGKLDVRIPELKGHVGRLETAVRKLGASIIFATMAIVATLMFLGGHQGAAAGIGIADVLLLAWIVLSR